MDGTRSGADTTFHRICRRREERQGREIGPALRKVRRARGVTLEEIAQEAGLSKSFISQVESGGANPSIASLKRIANALDFPLADLFLPASDALAPESPSPSAVVIHPEQRRMLISPKGDGVMYHLFPLEWGDVELTYNEYQPGYDTGEEMYTHAGEECGLVLTGVLDVTVDGRVYALAAGDSIYFPSTLPHRFRNRGSEVVTTLWVNTPRSY